MCYTGQHQYFLKYISYNQSGYATVPIALVNILIKKVFHVLHTPDIPYSTPSPEELLYNVARFSRTWKMLNRTKEQRVKGFRKLHEHQLKQNRRKRSLPSRPVIGQICKTYFTILWNIKNLSKLDDNPLSYKLHFFYYFFKLYKSFDLQ